MPNVDHHTPGNFCWIELATTDQSAAKTFYHSLFGWNANDMPMGPGSFYTIFRMNGRDVSAGATMDAKEIASHIPPHWNLYIAVENADAAVTKAGQLGATIIAPAFDVFDAGRMAVIQDPTGAIFMVWQAGKNTGIGIVGEAGAFCWADLNTADLEKAKKFYSAMFGWTIEAGPGEDPTGYLHIENAGKMIGGIPPVRDQGSKAPSHWMIYFMVANVDESAEKAKSLGASLHMPPTTFEGVGRMAVMADPQGVVSALFTSARRP
jgi:uncharacterized protein